MSVPIGTVIIHAREIKTSVAFYRDHFGFENPGDIFEGLIELTSPGGGAGPLMHQAAKSMTLGQVGVKLSFHEPDVPALCTSAERSGFTFGSSHEANGRSFADATDPDNDSTSISSRVFQRGAHS